MIESVSISVVGRLLIHAGAATDSGVVPRRSSSLHARGGPDHNGNARGRVGIVAESESLVSKQLDAKRGGRAGSYSM